MTYVRPTQDVDETDITEPSRDSILSFTGLENIYDISISNLQNLTPEQSLDIEQKMHKHIKQKTFWLDNMEAKTLGSAAVSPEKIDAQLIMQEILLEDIAKMSHEVDEKKNRFCEAYPKDTGNGQLIIDTLDRLWERLQTVDKAVRHQMKRLRNRVSEVMEYQTQLSILHSSLANHKQLVLDTLSDEPNKKAWEQLQDLENLASKLRWFEMQIFMIRARQQKLYEEPANVQELHNLQAILDELQGLVSAHRPALSKHHVAESRYEQALSDMTELLCAGEDKMASTCSVDKPQGLAVWLKQHKEFFQGLGHLMLMVDKLADRSSSSCQQHLDPRRAELMSQASSLLAQSQEQGREQQQVLQAWEDIEEEYKTLSQMLTGMEALVPSDRVQEETEQEIMDHINIYQNLKSSLELSQPRLQRLLESGRNLQGTTKHYLPDSHLVDLGERWLACSALVTTELHCLQNMLHHWVSFQKESAELEHWLKEAQTHVTFWQEEIVNVSLNPQDLRTYLTELLELSMDMEEKSTLKTSVQKYGSHLLQLKKTNLVWLKERLGDLDGCWIKLLAIVPKLKEKLYQALLERQTSRQVIDELCEWMDMMEKVLNDDDDKIEPLAEVHNIQPYCHKYKGYKMELAAKQTVVKFVNNLSKEVSGQEVDSKRSDKTEYAEHLGAMNQRWQLLQGHIQSKVQRLETLLDCWLGYENGVESLKGWLKAKAERLETCRRIGGSGDNISARTALHECQEIEVKLKVKHPELEKMNHTVQELLSGYDHSPSVKAILEDLQLNWTSMSTQLHNVKGGLHRRVEMWNTYNDVLHKTRGQLANTEYTLEDHLTLSGSSDMVMLQVERLQALQGETEGQDIVDKLNSATAAILQQCNPCVEEVLQKQLQQIMARWNTMQQKLATRLEVARGLLASWNAYSQQQAGIAEQLQDLEDQARKLVKAPTGHESSGEEMYLRIQECQTIHVAAEKLHLQLVDLERVGDRLMKQLTTLEAEYIHVEISGLVHRQADLLKDLARQKATLQGDMEEFQQFHQTLGELEAWLRDAEKLLSQIELQKSSEPHSICSSMRQLKDQMLHLIELSTKLDKVNELGYKLPLEDVVIHQLQALNRNWTRLSNLTCEHLSKLQASLLQQQSFLEKCQSWLEFLEHTEHTLGKDIFGSEQTLHAQQRCHELFQAEMFSRQQILHSIISSGQSLMDQGEIEDRDEFDAQLALLSDQWLGVVRRAQQRKGLIDGTIKQWQHYREVGSRLRCWLEENTIRTDSSQLQPIFSLEKAHVLLEDVKLKEKSYLRHHGTYSLALEAGKPLLLVADPRTEEKLQEELMEIQQKWKATGMQLEERHSHLAGLLKKWVSCEKGINNLTEKIRSMKEKLSLPLPEIHKELKIEECRSKNVDIALESYTVDVAQLLEEKQELSKYFGIEETTFLEERINSLLRQLVQLRNRASLRNNEASHRLNRWSLFNMKHQEFYQWLSKMENKISSNGNLSIEEILENLHKHIQEEVNAAAEQKSQLEQLGRILIRTSDDTRASEIQYRLGKVEQRWERLQDVLKARVKKLQETLQALDQLDKNLNGLRSWLCHIEAELSRPVVFMACDAEEIRHKLEEQQSLQRDIEQHSTGVASVLALCDMLLRDCDACSTEAETNSIQQATSTLDRRWRNICTMSMERKFSMHEIQRMWKKFHEDYRHFEEWLEKAEQKVSHGKTSCILYSTAKEELKKFEALERKLQESLTQLELLNKQYRRLAREGRTDTTGHLRDMVTKGNHRWDDLQRHVVAILRRLRHFTGKWDDFESKSESMTVWLTEMDLQITNMEHFSDSDPQSKIQQLKVFQQEKALNNARLEELRTQALYLMQCSDPLDAVSAELGLEELHRRCHDVFGRVERYLGRLNTPRLMFEPEDVSYGADLEEISDLICSEHQSDTSSSMSLPAFCITSPMVHLHHHIQGRELTSSASPSRHDIHSCSGLDTPASTSSLEWDHYDVEEEMDTEGSRVKVKLVEKDGASGYHSRDNLSDMEPTLEDRVRQLGQALMESRLHLQRTERAVRSRTPTGPELDSTYSGYTKLLKECQRSIETVKCASEKLSGEEISGLDVGASERQSLCVIERWEILQAQALGKELRMKQTLQQQQEEFESNVDSIRSWLEQIEPELDELRGLHTPTDIHDIELHISKLKELQHAVESHKPIILLVNTSNLEDAKPQDGLRQLNQRWDRAWRCIEDWRLSLQDALMRCQDFHEMSHSLLVWLENLDRKKRDAQPITSGLDHGILQNKHRMLSEVRKELKDTEQRVTLLQDMSTQLLVNAEGQNCLEAKERVRVIANRLKLLIKEVTQDIQTVGQLTQTTDNQWESLHGHLSEMDSASSVTSSPASFTLRHRPGEQEWQTNISESGTSFVNQESSTLEQRFPTADSSYAARELEDSSMAAGSDAAGQQPRARRRQRSLLKRVLCATLPLYLLLLLLLFWLFCLVPVDETDFSCGLRNNFAYSLHPMLHYPNGQPPT